MTNRSIKLLRDLLNKSYNVKENIIKSVTEIEFSRIVSQARNFCKIYDENELANNLIECKNSEELFNYLDKLSVIEISLLSSFGIDVSYMNLLKVSE